MEWLFDGLGTMLLGLILGGGVGGVIGHKVGVNSVRQSQSAGKGSTQVQVAGDYKKRAK